MFQNRRVEYEKNRLYVRVSSVDQNLKRQLQQMNEIGIDIIYKEKVSGATQDRPVLGQKHPN